MCLSVALVFAPVWQASDPPSLASPASVAGSCFLSSPWGCACRDDVAGAPSCFVLNSFLPCCCPFIFSASRAVVSSNLQFKPYM